MRAAAAISCLLAGTAPSFAQAAPQTLPAAPGMPPEPTPNFTQPLFMRGSAHDYSKERGYWPNPIAPYSAITTPAPRFTNSLQLDQLVKNGKIYLSLSDAVLLALQNNYDIAIQRLNLDIADTDILRAHAGQAGIQGIPTSLVTGTQGGSTASVSSVGGGPGGSGASSSVAGTGPGGLSLSTNGAGPTPENLDPTLQGTIEINHVIQPEQSPIFSGGLPAITQNTNTYNFTFNKGFITGTNMTV
ncbi:MAG: TolC family protein, partial [Acidobacteriaceae bacterium]